VNPRFIGSCGFAGTCGTVSDDLRKMNCGDPKDPVPGQVRREPGRPGPLGRPRTSVG
jgi:hypothetical protein